MAKKLKVIFMGTPEFSVPALRALVEAGHNVVAVYSQPPRPKGRGQQVQNSPVHDAALAAGLPVRTPKNFKDPQDVADFAAVDADVAVVVAYGLILPKAILDAPRQGCLNIHASLLPRWRGAAPIQRAVLAGDAETGVTIMQMDEGLDTGAIVLMKKIPITDATTSAFLYEDLSAIGAAMITDVLSRPEILSTPQPADGVTYAAKLGKEEGHIDWSQDSASIMRRIRAFAPWPGTWSIDNGARIKILGARLDGLAPDVPPGTVLDGGRIVCGDGNALLLTRVQPEGKKPMDAVDAVNGGYLKRGDILS